MQASHTAAARRTPRSGSVVCRSRSSMMSHTLDIEISIHHDGTVLSRTQHRHIATCRGCSVLSRMYYNHSCAFHARTAAPRSRRNSPFAYCVRRSWWASTRGIGSVVGHARRRCWGCSLGTVRACVHACNSGQDCRPRSSRYACCARIASPPSSQAVSPRGLQGPSWAPRGSTSLSFSSILPATHRARPIKKEIVAVLKGATGPPTRPLAPASHPHESHHSR